MTQPLSDQTIALVYAVTQLFFDVFTHTALSTIKILVLKECSTLKCSMLEVILKKRILHSL